MFSAAHTNRFEGAARITSRPYKSICRGGSYYQPPRKSICRGGCSTSRPYKQVFVGAIQSRTAPTVCFSAKKNSNLQFKIALPNARRPTFRTAFALPNAPRPRLQAQEYSINYNYKSNSQEYIQSIIKYTNSIHIVINILELAFQSHKFHTEDLYLTQTLSHVRRL